MWSPEADGQWLMAQPQSWECLSRALHATVLIGPNALAEFAKERYFHCDRLKRLCLTNASCS